MYVLSGESLRHKYLDDEEVDRLFSTFPELKGAPDKWCPTCYKDEGIVCDCELQTQLFKHYMSSGIGSLYHRKSWDDYEFPNKDVRDFVEVFMGDKRFVRRGVGAFVHGTYGVGKTMLVSLMLKDMVKSGEKVYSSTFVQLMDTMTRGWKSDEDKDFFDQKVMKIPVLLIDDVGKEFENKLTKNTFDNLIRFRVQSMKTTFITSNLTMEEVGAKYGDAVYSLLQEACLKVSIPSSKDHRKGSFERSLSDLDREIV